MYENCIALIRAISAELRCTLAPVSRLIESVAGRSQFANLDFLQMTSQLCLQGYSFNKAFSQAIAKSACLNTEDKEILAPLSEVLGSTDLEGQLSSLELTESLLQQSLKKARIRRESHSRLYTTAGILAGVAFAIVML